MLNMNLARQQDGNRTGNNQEQFPKLTKNSFRMAKRGSTNGGTMAGESYRGGSQQSKPRTQLRERNRDSIDEPLIQFTSMDYNQDQNDIKQKGQPFRQTTASKQVNIKSKLNEFDTPSKRTTYVGSENEEKPETVRPTPIVVDKAKMA